MNQKFKHVNRQKVIELADESKELTAIFQTILKNWDWTKKPNPEEFLDQLKKAKDKIFSLSQKVKEYQEITQEIL